MIPINVLEFGRFGQEARFPSRRDSDTVVSIQRSL